jgi:hypothetical protein
MTTFRLALALIAVAGGLARDAGASVLCRTPSRSVAERSSCRAREKAIPLVDVGPAGLEGPAGPAGTRGRGAASIVDAAGTPVGPVFWVRPTPAGSAGSWELTAFAVVEHEAVGGLAALGIVAQGDAAGTVLYADTACTGTPYVLPAGLLPLLQVIEDTVFLPVTPAPKVTLVAEETADPARTCATPTPRGGCCVVMANPQTVRAGFLAVAGRTTLGALGLRGPFSARAE